MKLLKICVAVLAGFVLGIMLRPATVRAHGPIAVYVQKAKLNNSITPTGSSVVGFSCVQSGECYIASQ
jgi:hypothetical protein